MISDELEALERQTPLNGGSDSSVWSRYCQALAATEADHPEWDAPIALPVPYTFLIGRRMGWLIGSLTATAAAFFAVIALVPKVSETPNAPPAAKMISAPKATAPEIASDWDVLDTKIAAAQETVSEFYTAYPETSLPDLKLRQALRSAAEVSVASDGLF